MSKIAGMTVTVDGIPYTYEAHTMHKVAEILAGTLRVISTGETDSMGQPTYSSTIDSFDIFYFTEA